MSIAGGLEKTAKNVVKMEANTMQIFSRNPRGSNFKVPSEKEVSEFQRIRRENNFGPVLAHAPYTMNPCSCDAWLREFAKNMMIDDISRMSFVPGNLYNFHPGSHVKQGVDVGIEFTAKMLSDVTIK